MTGAPPLHHLTLGRRLLTPVLACWLLTACAIITKPPELAPGIADPAAWQAHRSRLADLDTWSIQGRAATGQLLGWTGNLSWRQRGPRFDVRLSGPLGAGGFYAFGTLQRVTIRTGDKKFVTTHPQRLVRRILGWRFPLRPLRYWAKGIPAPGPYKSISVNSKGRLKELVQRGWQISYLAYTKQPGQPALPQRIVLDNGETRIRLVVSRWFNLGGNDKPNLIDSRQASKQNTRVSGSDRQYVSTSRFWPRTGVKRP